MATICINGMARKATCKEEIKAIHDSLDLLGGKWKLRILLYLANRTGQQNHFKKMLREIEGISAKMLAKELKELEINMLVSRQEQDTRPLTVVYAITSYGQSVLPIREHLVQWGLNHRQKLNLQSGGQ